MRSTIIQREVRGRINKIQLEHVTLTLDVAKLKTNLKQVRGELAKIFQTLLPFLFPPSYFALTTWKTHLNNSSSPICLMDQTFQRHVSLSLNDGKYFRQRKGQFGRLRKLLFSLIFIYLFLISFRVLFKRARNRNGESDHHQRVFSRR